MRKLIFSFLSILGLVYNSSHTTGTARLITFLMEAKNGSGLGVAIKGFLAETEGVSLETLTGDSHRVKHSLQ